MDLVFIKLCVILLTMLDSHTYQYLAGFIDADGSIAVYYLPKYNATRERIRATNVSKLPLELLVKYFGGKITERNDNPDKWKKSYEWELSCSAATRAIEKIYPYLLLKKPQACLALRVRKIKDKYRSGRLRNKDLNRRINILFKRIADRSKILNAKGRDEKCLKNGFIDI